MSLRLSIVVCTHRRFSILEIAIKSLSEQIADKNSFEVIVVDNDLKSNPEVNSIVKNAAGKINVVYIHESFLGLSLARNRGGKMAKADYVGYIDDDAKVPKEYISKAIRIIDQKQPDYFGGPYYPYYLNEKPNWYKDIYQSGIPANENRFLKQNEFLKGTNMIYKRSLLEKLNWFDKKFGMAGNKIGYGEETALQLKAQQLSENLKIWYDAELIVEHLVSPEKFKLWDKMKRSYNNGRSQAYLWLTEPQIAEKKRKAPFTLFKTLLSLMFKGLPGILFHDRSTYPKWQNYTYEVISKYFASLGQEWRYTKDLLIKN